MRFLIVAKKEFIDIVSSRRFTALLVTMVIFFLMSILQTLQSTAGGRISTAPMIGFFGSSSLAFVGGIFGIALGFDLITREKESGTLRTLLTRPVFRDEIIIGKAIAAFLAICVAVAITFLFMLGALTMRYTPSFDDVTNIGKMMFVTIAYLYTFFSIAFLISALTKNSSTSLTVAMGVFIVLALFLPLFSNYIAQAIVGPPPENPFWDFRSIGNVSEDPRFRSYLEEMRSYREKVQSITSSLSIFSPVSSYSTILNSLTASGYFRTVDITKNLLSFIIVPIVLFVLAYLRFTREEL
ncbi:MAG: ABC transporter permease [Archaeoglobaceae archaeon]